MFMLRRKLNSVILLLLVFSLFTCIDPYTPHLSGYESVLVVEGLITNENIASEIKLSRSVESKDSVPERVTDAVVKINDELGNVTILNNCGEGSYKTDPATFIGEIGKTYTLHISTIDGREYVSEPSQMLSVPDIDTVYYERDEIFTNNRTETQVGIRFYVNPGVKDDDGSYFRWEMVETWKFRLPSPKRYSYFNESLIVALDTVKEYCWKSGNSDDIFINSVLPGHSGIILKEPLLFIASNKSDRLVIRYSILIKQYSISRKEYDFWNNLKKINETGGNIFDTQPWAVESNVTNVDDPSEKILGYFKVSAVKQKRIYISPNDLTKLDIPFFTYDCQQVAMAPSDYPRTSVMTEPLTWDGLVDMFASERKYVFVEPVYNPSTRELLKLVFAKRECSDCELTGTSRKPYFWTD